MKRAVTLLLSALIPTLTASAQDWAKARLEKSPRHLEWVKVKHDQREVNCFIAYPEVKDKATSVVLIHEIFGLTDWVRGVADELAEAGYLVIAPDLLSGTAPNGGGTAELGGSDAVRKAIGSLNADQITADLNAVADYVTGLPACNGKVTVAGFCWGGAQTFRFATNRPKLAAAFVFYGVGSSDESQVVRIQCPVYGYYGETDSHVTPTVEKTTTLMKKAGKTFEPVIYKGASHGFMRMGEAPDASADNKKARDAAWERLVKLLKKAG